MADVVKPQGSTDLMRLKPGAYSCAPPTNLVAADLPHAKIDFFTAISKPGAEGARSMVAYEQEMWAALPSVMDELRAGNLAPDREAFIGLYLLYSGMIIEAVHSAVQEGRLAHTELPMHGCDRPATLSATLLERSKMGLELLERAAKILSQPHTFPYHQRGHSADLFPGTFSYRVAFYENGKLPDADFDRVMKSVKDGGAFEMLVTLVAVQGTLSDAQEKKIRKAVLFKPLEMAWKCHGKTTAECGYSPLAPNARASAMALLGNIRADSGGYARALYQDALDNATPDWPLRDSVRQRLDSLRNNSPGSTLPAPREISCASCHTPRSR